MAQQIQLRKGTAAEWTAANPVLADGEMGLEKDTKAYKIGDGVLAWNALSYAQLSGEWQALLLAAQSSDPSPPAAGKLAIYARDTAGRIMPKWIGPSGLDTPFQPAIFANGVQMISPEAGTAFSVLGMALRTAVGTVSHPVIAAGSMRLSTRRGNVLSADTANAAAELRNAATQCYRGETVSSEDLGGFFLVQRFACSTTTALQRCAFGLWSSTAATSTTQNPSSLTNCILAGWDSADTNLQIMSNEASGTCTKVDLGSDYPANNTSAIYDVTFFAKPNASAVSWRVARLDADVPRVSGTISAVGHLPISTVFLAWHAYMNNGGTAATAGFDLMRMYLETDY